MSVLTFHQVSQSFGAYDVFLDLGGSVPWGAKIGLIGPNGIGKTTLLRILAGIARPTGGAVHAAKGARIGYLQQEAVRAFADQGNTVYDEMLTVYADLQAQAARLRHLETAMADGDADEALLERYGRIQEAFELAGGYEYELRIQQVLTGLGFSSDQHHMPLAHCSGGQKTRALLARLLLERPDLLVLDEPTNHLDVEAVEWLEGTLHAWDGAVLIVSHDRYFLDRVVDVIWEMSRNGIELYRGNYSAYLQQREGRWERRDKEFEATRERFYRELDFIKRNIARDSTTAQAQGRLRRLVRGVKAVEVGGVQALQGSWLQFTEQVGISKTKWNVAEVERHIKALQSPNPRLARLAMRLQTAQRGGNIVLRTRSLRIGYPGVPLFEAEDVELKRLECAALIGANGTGKTTFLRTVLGQVEPLRGEVRLGANLQPGYFSQAHETLDPEKTVLEELLSRQEMPVAEARNYLARYLFREDEVFRPVRALSGGERGRLTLAILALQKANLLLLDEPTNHLDLPAQEVLEEALQAYEGTVILVSHDRYLVDKLATQIWELRDGTLTVHKGGYASFLEARQRALERVPEVTVAKAVSISRRSASAGPRETGEEALAQTEAQIGQMEASLERLSQGMASAAHGQRWEEMHSLNREYEDIQAQLEILLARWEALVVDS